MTRWSRILVYSLVLLPLSFGGGITVSAVGLPNDPQAPQWSYQSVDVYRAWEAGEGSPGVVVAIIDNGFDETHPDLRDALWTNTKEISGNGIDDDQNGYADDLHGWNFVLNKPTKPLENQTSGGSIFSVKHHATVVAGIIGATANNHRDGAGIAYGVRLMNLQVVATDGSGGGDIAPLVEAIYYAVNNGASVINISMVGKGSAPQVRTAIEYAYQKGVVVSAAAGNDSANLDLDPEFPICADAFNPYTSIIGVSAIDDNRRLTPFSNIGATCVDLTAPGIDIGGPIRDGIQNDEGVSYSIGWNGTSFATPFATAAAALVKSLRPSWNVDQIVRTLKATVHHTPSDDEKTYQKAYGSGLIQVGRAVESARLGLVPPARMFVNGDYDRSFTAPRRILVASEGQGKYLDILQGNKVEVLASYLANALTFIPLRDLQGTVYYAVMRQKNTREHTITVYTTEGVQKFQWTVPAKKYTLIAADVEGDPGKEIALMAGDTGEIIVFALDGVKVGTIQGPEGWRNGFAAVRSIAETGKDEIITATESVGSVVTIRRITSLTARPEVLFTTSMKSLGSIAYVSEFSDPEQDRIILGTNVGVGGIVTVYTVQGALAQTFRPYDLSFRGGIQVSSVVYGERGKERIVVTPKEGAGPLRIFDIDGTRLLDRAIDMVAISGKKVVTAIGTY